MTPLAQCASAVLMVRPAAFGYNPETADTNAFQKRPSVREGAMRDAALAEFDAAVGLLGAADVDVIVLEDSPAPVTPDAVFPNNWITTHADGTVVLWPMHSPNRRAEVRNDVPAMLVRDRGFDLRRVVDLTPNAGHGRCLEGTGSLVFDHRNRVAYACLSPRTHRGMLWEAAELLGYETVVFRAAGPSGLAVYHTNVVMSIGEHVVLLCPDAIPDAEERRGVLDRLEATRRRVLALTPGQMSAFAANVLELGTAAGDRVLAMSETAWEAYTPAQRDLLEEVTRVLPIPIPTIESVGGGSLRCMLAEIFLSRKRRAGESRS